MQNSERDNKNGRNLKGSESADTSSSSSSSSESLLSSDSSTESMPPPPDGGYGWIIVVAAFFISLISDGISFSFGILYTELLAHFEESKSLTSWIGSVFYGTCMIGGPLASALATKFGCRKVTVFGGLLSAAGILISSFTESIGMLIFWFGFVNGLGMAMGYVTSLVMVAFYFEKKRALATGLSVCGSGIGTFVFAPLTEILLTIYGWRGCLMIWSGISLNLCVCGCLLRPLKFTPEERKMRALKQFEKMSEKMSRTMSYTSFRSQSRHASQSEDMNSSADEGETDELEHCHSQIQIPTFIKEKKVHIPIELLKEAKNNNGVLRNYIKSLGSAGTSEDIRYSSKDEDVFDAKNVEESEKKIPKVDTEVIADDKSTAVQIVKEPKQRKSCLKKSDGVKKHQQKPKHVRLEGYLPMYRKDIFYRGNLMKLSTGPGQIRSTSCPALYTSHWDDSDSSSDEEWDWEFWKYLRVSKPLKRVMRIMFDPAILKHPLYITFALSSFILYFWYDVPYIFMADRALEYGISEKQASFLISILGIVNTFGQIIYGFLGDRQLSLSVLYGTSLIACGATVMLVPYFTDYIALACLSGTFGLFISANYSLGTVILVEFLGIDKLSNAYGLTMLMQGIANLIGPPVAGWLYDFTGRYDATFYAGGVWIIFAGILLLWVPVYHYIRRRRLLRWRLSSLNIDKIVTREDSKENNMNKISGQEENGIEAHESTCATLLVPKVSSFRPAGAEACTEQKNWETRSPKFSNNCEESSV